MTVTTMGVGHMAIERTMKIMPVGRGDHIISLAVYHADDLATTRELAALRAKVADQALTIACQAGHIGALEAELAARPRWAVVRRAAWVGPGWLQTTLAWLIVARSRLGPACDALYQGGPLERRG
jgi:hypothetical protein